MCFLAQQCAEKYLKARLCEAGVRFAKIHNLVVLLKQVLSVEPLWDAFRPELAQLTTYAVNFRYPGVSADRAMAKEAQQYCRAFRKAARAALGLKP